MISLSNLNRQHIAIKEEVNILESEINKGKLSMSVSDIAFHICKLTGLIKIHLLEESRFLYPDLLKSEDSTIKELTNQYILDMGDLVDDYTIFKFQYSKETNIHDKMDTFQSDAKRVITALKERLKREESELYSLITVNNL